MLNFKRRATMFFSFLCIVALLLFIECNIKYPADITLYEGENIEYSPSSPYSLSMPASFGGVLGDEGEIERDSFSQSREYITAKDTGEYSASVKLFGVIPVKNVSINVTSPKMLIPSGEAIGIKLFTEGLLCVGVSEILDIEGNIINLASRYDINMGDIFVSANGKKLETTEQFAEIVSQSQGNTVDIVLLRNGQELLKKVKPVKTADGFKIGIWVRDSTAGIGTLSFVDAGTKSYGALGHPICDNDTGMIMPVSGGSVIKAEIFGVQKGEKGKPGELKGSFRDEKDLGTIEKNTNYGIYGNIDEISSVSGQSIPIASKNAIKKGKAQIISNISGNKTERFDIEIQRILTFGSDDNKNMVIKVTDEDLLDATGGIVQGMSGSPILQDGKLVGAVTHVFVNDPTRGYGIFIENMLAEAEKIK